MDKGLKNIDTLYKLGDEAFKRVPHLRPFRWLYRLFGRRAISKGLKRFESRLDFIFDKTDLGLVSTPESSDRVKGLLSITAIAVIIYKSISDKDEVETPPLQVVAEINKDEEPILESSAKFSSQIGTDFNVYAPKLSKFEGGYVDSLADRGGKTYRGVTLTTFRSFFKDQSLQKEDLVKMDEATWRKIMKTYWDAVKGDYMVNQSVAEMIADWAVGSGPVTAIKKVQKAIGVPITGRMDELTLSTINNSNQRELWKVLRDAREQHFRDIVAKDKETDPRKMQKRNLKGWLNRLNQLEFVDQDTSYTLNKPKNQVNITERYSSGSSNSQ